MKDYLKKIFGAMLNIVPLKNYIIFESNPDLSDNAYAYYNYLLKLGYNKKYKFFWLLNNCNNAYPDIENVKYIYRHSKNIFEKLYKHYIISVSKYIIDCNVFVKPTRKSQIRVHLGHGMPIKVMDEYCNKVGRTDILLSTSDYFKDIYKDLFKVEKEKILSTGFPRNDVFNQDNYDLKNRLFGSKKVIIWMPTYRQHINTKNAAIKNILPLGVPVLHSSEDIRKIENTLEINNCILLLRLHPAQNISYFRVNDADNIIIADNDFLNKIDTNLYKMLTCTDALITDYSSIYYDYLLYDKPIALMTEDIDEFFKVFKCAYDNFEENIVGEYIYTVEQFCKFIENVSAGNDIKLKERTQKKLLYHNYISGSSCERLFNYMKEKYNF